MHKPLFDRIIDTVIGLADNKSLSQAAREAHTTPKTFNRMNRELGLITEIKPERGNRKAFVTNKAIIIDDKGNVYRDVILDAQSAKNYKDYAAVIKGSTTLQGAEYDLRRLKGLELYDINGNKYKPTFNVDTLNATMVANDIDPDELFHSEKRK